MCMGVCACVHVDVDVGGSYVCTSEARSCGSHDMQCCTLIKCLAITVV